MERMGEKYKSIRHSIKQFFNVIRYFYQIVWRGSKLITVTIIILNVCGGLTLGIELWSMTSLIDRLTEQSSPIISLLPWVLFFIGAIIIKQTAEVLVPYLAKKLQERTSAFLKDDIFKKANRLKLTSFETEEYYNRLENAKRSSDKEIAETLDTVGYLLQGVVELFVIIIAIANSGIIFSILILIGSIPLFIVKIKMSKEFDRVNYQQSPIKRQLQYWVNLSTTRSAATELRLFNLGPFFYKNWETRSKQIISELWQSRKLVASLELKSTILLAIILAIILIAAVYAGVSGLISIGTLVALLYMLNRYEVATNNISNSIEMLAEFYYQFQYVPQFLQSGEEELQEGIVAPKNIQQEIVFENVNFAYPGSTKLSLRNVSFKIRPGEKIAIVGENGAGKSTLASLLLGLYEPTSGRILVDGFDLKEFNSHTWRKRAAAVFQNFVKYQLSAKENIVYGDITKSDNRERLRQSAKKSGVDEVIQNLPSSYETLLGREYENSNDLSGGEWQKIAIARAYFKEADLLVLDEPTAALDAQSEFELYQQFSNVSDGKTTILISHRLGSARLADKIIFLQAGEIVEIGSHEELLAKDGFYSELYHKQAEWYQHEESSLRGT